MNKARIIGGLLLCFCFVGSALADDRIQYFRDIVIQKSERVDDAVCIGCAIRIKGQTHDVVAIWAGVEIESDLSSDVVVLGGGVHLFPGARVDGDVVTLGGPIVLEQGAAVTGEIDARPFYHFPGQRQVFWQGVVGLTGFNLLFVLLAYVCVRRRRVENMASTLRARPWATFFAGLIFVAICIGLYRLPWTTPRLYETWGPVYIGTTILFAIPYAAGFIGVCALLGTCVRFRGKPLEVGSLLATVCGAVAVTVLLLIPLAGLLAWVLLWFFALGAALVSRFGARPPSIETAAVG